MGQYWLENADGHRRTRREVGDGIFPGLKIFRANSVFRASGSCSKILKDKKYFSAVKNSKATLFLRASAKLLNSPE